MMINNNSIRHMEFCKYIFLELHELFQNIFKRIQLYTYIRK